jgi:serine protease inhibitor
MDVLRIMIGPVLKRPIFFLPAVVAAAIAGVVAVPPLPALAQQGQPQAGAADPADRARDLLAAAQAKLAFSLIEKIGSGPAQQATVSPASVASALGLVSNGADPKMKAAIAKALGFPADRADSLAVLEDVRARLAKGGESFAFADRIVFSPSTPPSKFIQAGFDKYNFPYEIADLGNPEEAARIDGWVKEVTKGAIPEILGGPVSKASFAALNALHFKSRWKTPFDPKLTATAPFTGLDGKSADVQMMRLGKATRAFRQERVGERKSERNFVAIDLPFADERFSLVIVTTREKPAAAKDFTPVASWLGGAGFTPHSGDLALPRFAASAREDLLPVLDGLGLGEARKSATALLGFGSDITLSQVTQRAMIDVDEEGAEAAAATAAIGSRSLEADDAIHMVVDKPFMYALRDKTTGMILVAGYVGTPPKGKTA